ncbi:glutamate racemase [Xylocopilactobacillus apicola]|uniref:Glutamate racemase n=1 Tax=Xylocopilactobacillus apicola TaxID=2932184 RepID=A0AAU9DD98_9LACO|nr:glutamate racemase [Xylocopilactobacillus apicola]BDR58787.1 hypothetical protein XA3_12280 [Xylocopilactobacillus apicola]
MNNRPIGYFDSGIGGLTALKEHFALLPQEDTIYVADEAHLPYGTKTQTEITDYSQKIVDFLISKDVKAIVCACNTSSAIALPVIEKTCPVPIFGVIEAGSQQAIKLTSTNQIVVLATKATVKSRKYDETIQKINPDCTVTDFAAQELVQIVEAGDYQNPNVQAEIDRLLAPLENIDADTMVLGCTHFPIIEKLINNATNQRFQMVNSGQEAVKNLTEFLKTNDLACEESSTPAQHIFYTTGNPAVLQNVGNKFLGEKIQAVQHLAEES